MSDLQTVMVLRNRINFSHDGYSFRSSMGEDEFQVDRPR